jgi:integrase/recombinase XerD
MNSLRQYSQEYLAVRRALGFKLVGEAHLLADFTSFVERSHAPGITTELAVTWTRLATHGSQAYLARRMRVARSFARYLHTLDPSTEVPPVDLFPSRNYRPAPYIYADTEILALMAAARTLVPPLWSATFETLIGLLAATGLRSGEALMLDRDDVDCTEGLLTVRNSKFGKCREVLLHDSTVKALKRYGDQRDRFFPSPATPSFFVSTRGTRLLHTSMHPTFRLLRSQAGIGQPSSQPRLHDLRHTLAVNTLLRWYRDGGDVASRMPLLSTYLGHVDPAATYWYYSDSRVIPMPAPSCA